MKSIKIEIKIQIKIFGYNLVSKYFFVINLINIEKTKQKILQVGIGKDI